MKVEALEIKHRFKLVILLHLTGGVIVVPLGFGADVFYTTSQLKFLSIACLFWNFYTLYTITRSFRNPSFLFYFCFGVFLLTRVALDLSGGRDFGETIFFSNYTFSASVQRRLLVNLILALWAWHLGAIIGAINGYGTRVFRSSHFLFRSGRFFFLFGVCFALYSYLRIAYDVYQNGYLIRFSGDAYYTKSLLLTITEELYILGFYMILASRPSFVKLRPYLVIYVIGMLIELGSGARGPVLTRFVIMIWAFIFLYNYKLSILKGAFLTIGMVGMSIVVGAYRLGLIIDADLLLMFLDEFLYNIGISVQVPGYAIVHKDAFMDYGFIDLFARTKDYFNVVLNGVFGDMFYLNIDMEPMHARINFLVNPTKARLGMGMGGSYVAELFLFGQETAQLVGGLLFGYVFNRLYNILKINNLGFVLLLIVLPSLIYTPRHALFFFIQAGFLSYIFLLIFVFIKSAMLNRRV